MTTPGKFIPLIVALLAGWSGIALSVATQGGVGEGPMPPLREAFGPRALTGS